MGISSAIYGCSGLVLSDEERGFFRDVQPWGFILFGRNIDDPDQVARLVDDLKFCVQHDPVPVLIDQEGGRVRRLRPPHWPAYGAGEIFGRHYSANPETGKRIAWLQSRLMACDLLALGINVDCLPVLDVPVGGSHDVIGDRAYGTDPSVISDIGRAVAGGLLDGGVLPVIKHIPGHGRATVDSHKDLPVVDADFATLNRTDFEPFKQLASMPLAMTAHVVYSAIDPENPATFSKGVIEEIIRGQIGFQGLLMCDDLSMNALSGDFAERTQRAFAAGCDVVLHCNGNMDEMLEIAESTPILADHSTERARQAMDLVGKAIGCDEKALRDEYETLCESSDYAPDPTEALL